MSTVDTAFCVIAFLGLLVLNVIFYGFSTAVQNLNIAQIQEYYEEKHDKKSKRILKVSENITKYVNTLQVVVTIVQLVMGGVFLRLLSTAARSGIHRWIAEPEAEALRRVLRAATVGIPFLLLIYVLLLFSVLIPKKVAAIHPRGWAYACVPITYAMCWFLTPVTAAINASANGILRLFGIKHQKGEAEVTEEEIISMVNEGHEQGVLEQSEAEMITNIFEFGDKTVRDIMTNRQNMNMLDCQMRLSEAIAYMLEGTNSRYPVYSETPDQIIGFLHLKDACRYQHKLTREAEREQKTDSAGEHAAQGKNRTDPKLKSCRNILRNPEFVPETLNIDDLFHSMQSKRLQMVIAVDEYGQTVGLVAMEDILEEIVGNIQDEYDEEQRFLIKTGQDRYIADGMTPLEDLHKVLGIRFDDDIEVDTLNGFMILHLEHIPDEKEHFSMEYQGYEFRINRVEKHMIRKALITKLRKEPKEEDTAAKAAKDEKKVV